MEPPSQDTAGQIAADSQGTADPAPPIIEAAAAPAAPASPAERAVPAVEGQAVMGMSADAMEALLRGLEPELVTAARERRARELLGLTHRDAPPTAERRAPHDEALRAMTLVDAIGYDLWTVAPQVSRRYAALPNGDRPALVEIMLGDAERCAGLAPADAACGVRTPANCFLSWHMAAKLLELLEAQRAQQKKDGAPLFVWNNLLCVRQVLAPGTKHDFNDVFDTVIKGTRFTLAFLDPWHAPSMLTRIW